MWTETLTIAILLLIMHRSGFQAQQRDMVDAPMHCLGSSQQITYQNWFRNTHRHSSSFQAGIPFFRGAGFRPKPCRNDRTPLPGRLFVVSCLRLQARRISEITVESSRWLNGFMMNFLIPMLPADFEVTFSLNPVASMIGISAFVLRTSFARSRPVR